MQPEFWHSRWETQQIGFHQTTVNPRLEAFWHTLALDAGSRTFVPLCGKSRDMLWLLEQGHRVLGVELSPLAVEAFFAENRLNPNHSQYQEFTRWEQDEICILCGNFFALTPQDLADVGAVYDRAALIALPPDLRIQYAQHMTRLLPIGTKVLLTTIEYPQEQLNGPPFSVDTQEVHRLYGKHFSIECLHHQDVLAESPRFLQNGVTALSEVTYRMVRRGG